MPCWSTPKLEAVEAKGPHLDRHRDNAVQMGVDLLDFGGWPTRPGGNADMRRTSRDGPPLDLVPG
jgi:hypothetical protein